MIWHIELEDAYSRCLKNWGRVCWKVCMRLALLFELRNQGIAVQSQVPVPVLYKEIQLELGFRLDLLVENEVIIEIKSVEA